MFRVKGNRLSFLGHQGPSPLMSPGGLDPSDTITIMPTRIQFGKIIVLLPLPR